MPPVQTLVNFPVRKTRQRRKTVVEDYKDQKSLKQLTPSPRKNCRFNKENSSKLIEKTASCSVDDKTIVAVLETPKRKTTNLQNSGLVSPTKKTKNAPKSEPQVKRNTFTPLQLFKQDVSVYQQAKSALHSSIPSYLVGRAAECSELSAFLTDHLKDRRSGSLYLSGVPGTGKTACITYLLDQISNRTSFISLFINCMTVRQSSSIFDKIGTELGCGKCRNQREFLDCIEKKLTQDGSMIILVLDEMDHLNSKNQDVLYTVFEWPRLPKSRVILIGISNALDLTDRVLPRLHACGCRPKLFHFAPYSREQIVSILSDRLKQSSDLIKPSALQMCARKIAACTGDIRKALDTCRRALELVEREVKTQCVLRPTSDNRCNEGSPQKSPRKISPVPKQVDIPQILSVLHEIYGSRVISSETRASTIDDTLPIQQKLLLCTLLLLTSRKSRDIPFGKLQETYSRVCKKQHIGEVNSSELLSVCSLLESRGLVQVKCNREARLSKVFLKINEEEMLFVLKDKALLSTVLNDNTVVG